MDGDTWKARGDSLEGQRDRCTGGRKGGLADALEEGEDDALEEIFFRRGRKKESFSGL